MTSLDPRIYLFGDITVRKALRIIRKIKRLINIGAETIYFYICSDGGDFDSACAIIDEILGAQSVGITVYTICQSVACSGAADILSLGSNGYRFATHNSTIMMHPMSFATNEDYASNIKITAEHSSRRSQEIILLVSEACGYKTIKRRKEFEERINKGWWLTGKEAKKYGVVDGIWDYKQEKNIKYIDLESVDGR